MTVMMNMSQSTSTSRRFVIINVVCRALNVRLPHVHPGSVLHSVALPMIEVQSKEELPPADEFVDCRLVRKPPEALREQERRRKKR